MFKSTILTALLLASVTTNAFSEIVFIGTIKVTAVTPQCKNIRVNEFGNSVFHPNIGANKRFAGLSWMWTHYSHGHLLDRDNFDSTPKLVVSGGVGWGDTYIKELPESSLISITSYKPALANIKSDTETLAIVGKIARPFNDPGGVACVASFRASYVKDARQ